MKEEKRGQVFMGIDQHKHYSEVAVVDGEGKVLERRRLLHSDKEEMLGYFQRYGKEKAEVVIEATGSWYWLADMLEEAEIKPVLAHPYKTRIIADSKIKTDSIDAYWLAQLHRASLIPESYLAPVEMRELKERLRYRMALVKIRTSLKCRIHSILEREGIESPGYADLFGKRGREWLKGISLAEQVGKSLKGYLEIIEHLNKLIETTDKGIKKKVKESEEAHLLETIPGVGYFIAHLLLVEIGDINRFLSAKKLCSYAGLTPTLHQSGKMNHTGKITKQGNKYLRWGLIEAAARAAVKDGYLRYFYKKIANKKGRQKARVAVARKLCEYVWKILKKKEVYKTRKHKPQASPGFLSGR